VGEQILRKSIHPRQKNYRPKEELKNKEKSKRKGNPKQNPATKGSNSVFFDIAGIDAKVSHHPQVREVR